MPGLPLRKPRGALSSAYKIIPLRVHASCIATRCFCEGPWLCCPQQEAKKLQAAPAEAVPGDVTTQVQVLNMALLECQRQCREAAR